ncbi:MAG: hypothetical protein C4541_06965 [Candidatus Auribacter fodinae]|jgi:hypothetical protein|uniref:Uncharacterized protein n=1 Tax=Candidatus Auribacter fodinae TaxID=2093366 RepID=A0A3A4QYU7_9BACT|nr:MAG: hypothetical protein C4541_06965 [Candidatus Auribacter fodinae]
MKSTFTRIVIILITCTVLIGINSNLMPRINTIRDNEGLTRNMPLDNAPPQFVLAVNLLGGLRCILVDALWLRTMKLREEGKFFEMAQLYKWICQLEPQIEDVWAHNAWNMAYNISFEMPYPQDRWRWINKAIHLLRDVGLVYNSRSAVIRREIAWIYAHKIGQQWDDMHLYYKKQLAHDFSKLVYGYDDLKQMKGIISSEDQSPPVFQDVTLLKTHKIQSIVAFNAAQESGVLKNDPFLFSDARIEEISRYFRAQEITGTYKMDLQAMIDLMEQFGPLDWRLPEPHAMYWATEGKEFAQERFYILYDRLRYLSLQSLCTRGRLVLLEDDNDGLYITSPDLRFVEPMNEYYKELLKEYEGSPSAKNIASAYYYFLADFTMLLYTSQNKELAESLFAELQARYPQKVNGASLGQYVMNQFMYMVQTGNHDQVKGMLFEIIREAFWNLAIGNDDQYSGYMELAQTLSAEYNRRIHHQERLVLPTMAILQQQVLDQIMNGDFPEAVRNSLQKRLNSPEKTSTL